jgi:YD repeat-containing protein
MMRQIVALFILLSLRALAQTPARRPAFPGHVQADQITIDRGKALYGVQCAFCHGSDARGGEGGPNLLRSQLVLNDQNGEVIATIVQNGREAMPKFDLTKAQIGDIAAYIHSFKVGGYDVSRMTPPSIVVGDATAGEADFRSTCGGCHSATGDLKGLASRYTDPKKLQMQWVSGGTSNAKGSSVTVTLPSGQEVSGRLDRIDDFFVSLTDPDGTHHTYTRDGERPKVVVHDPLKPHKDLLFTYTDKQIHNITAYLVTLK